MVKRKALKISQDECGYPTSARRTLWRTIIFLILLLAFVFGIFMSFASAKLTHNELEFSFDINLRGNDLKNVDTIFVKVVQGTSPLKLLGGDISVILNDTSNTTDFSHDIKINGTSIQPACDVSARGKLRFGKGALGIADTLELCVKTALDTYVWKVVSLI